MGPVRGVDLLKSSFNPCSKLDCSNGDLVRAQENTTKPFTIPSIAITQRLGKEAPRFWLAPPPIAMPGKFACLMMSGK